MVPASLATAMSVARIIHEVTDEGAETLFAYDEHDRVVSMTVSAIETDPRARRAARFGSSLPAWRLRLRAAPSIRATSGRGACSRAPP